VTQIERPTAAFALSLIAGILILINGALWGVAASFVVGFDMAEISIFYPEFAEYIALYCPECAESMMAAGGVVEWLAFVSTMLYVGMAIGVIFGVIVLLAAGMVYRNPLRKTAGGVTILILSIISIITGGGFIIGLILGIIGGALALSWRPSSIVES